MTMDPFTHPQRPIAGPTASGPPVPQFGTGTAGLTPYPVHQMAPAAAAPGWYPDPWGSGGQRWWDGGSWSAQTGAAMRPNMTSMTTVVNLSSQKSVGVAFLLTFFFSSLGLLYATVAGGVVMIIVEGFLFLLGFLTFGLAWILLGLTWVVCIIWGCVAVSGTNNRAQVVHHQGY